MLKFIIALPEDRGFLTKDNSFTKNVEEALVFNHENDVHLYIKKEADRFDTWVKENNHLTDMTTDFCNNDFICYSSTI